MACGARLLAVFTLLLAACGEHDHESTWRGRILSMETGEPVTAEIAEVAYPPFSEGIFPCSRCHVGGAPAEPVAGPRFPHATHVDLGLACADCHMPEGGTEPGPADPALCFGCHEEPGEGAPEGPIEEYFVAIRDGQGGYAFPARWANAELVAHHGPHAGAGVACATCHGEPSAEPFPRPRSAPLMESCVSCHEERDAPLDCATCHTEIRHPQHENIVLNHAEEQRGCFGCHNPDDRDVLRLASGETVPFERSFRLCGQCHGPKLRDWRLGLHGKRTGEWDGRQEYLLCVHCHNPHDPGFPPMRALERPVRPEEVR